MNLIKEKKIKKWIVNLALYLSFCFAGWYGARATVATVIGGISEYSFFANGFVAFIIAGIMPFLIYLLVVKILKSFLRHTPFLPLNEMFYALPFFYFGANVVIGLFGVLYYFVPIASIWGNIIVPLIVTACFFVWYMAFICKNYVKKYNWKAMVLYFGRMYITIALIITVIGLIAEVIIIS